MLRYQRRVDPLAEGLQDSVHHRRATCPWCNGFTYERNVALGSTTRVGGDLPPRGRIVWSPLTAWEKDLLMILLAVTIPVLLLVIVHLVNGGN
jgi:hypothetical protein